MVPRSRRPVEVRLSDGWKQEHFLRVAPSAHVHLSLGVRISILPRRRDLLCESTQTLFTFCPIPSRIEVIVCNVCGDTSFTGEPIEASSSDMRYIRWSGNRGKTSKCWNGRQKPLRSAYHRHDHPWFILCWRWRDYR